MKNNQSNKKTRKQITDSDLVNALDTILIEIAVGTRVRETDVVRFNDVTARQEVYKIKESPSFQDQVAAIDLLYKRIASSKT